MATADIGDEGTKPKTPASNAAVEAMLRELAKADLAPGITRDELRESDESNDDALQREVPPHHGTP
jgi:hypothetical protein